MAARFVPAPGLEKALSRMQPVRDAVLQTAGEIAERAIALAPEREGHYKRSIQVDSGVEGQVFIARVNAMDFKAVWIELGTIRTPAHHPLQRAGEAIVGQSFQVGGR